LDSRHIVLFSTKSPTKAQMVERLIRTLRSRQERYNTFKVKRRWVESFPLFVNSYNKAHHSALPGNMCPFDVNLKNEKNVWNHFYGSTLLQSPRQGKQVHLSQGDPVRLSKRKKTFEKSIYQNWTDEIFYVALVSKKTTPVTYRLEDNNEEPLEGVFYRQELTPVKFTHDPKNKEPIYAVENIVQKEKRKDGNYLLVKLRGYPESSNSWIRENQFTSIRKAT
jgi:hypothetical protein